MQFQDIVKDLNSSDLNEREISKRIVSGMLYVLESSGSVHKPGLIKLLNRTKNVLLKIRQNDSFVNNILNYLLHDLMAAKYVRDEVERRCISIERHFSFVNKKIAEDGSKKIKNNSKIFVLSYSENILNILRKVKIEGKNFSVNNIESKQHFGRTMADEISKIGIDVNHYPDSAINLALKGCDLALIEGFGVYNKKIISNMGANILVHFCEKEEVPIYVCIDGLKFEKRIDNFFDGNLINLKFEEIDLDKVFVISELGILRGSFYLEQLKAVYPWIISF